MATISIAGLNSCKPDHIKRYDYNFLTWLIGFTEGDGSFVINNRGDLNFIITQSTSDIQVLYKIKKGLGFGRVIKQGPLTSRFIVGDKEGLTRIIALFNGNLVFNKRRTRFKDFLNQFNKNYNTRIRYIN